ncbi:PilZ domain-containing protein [Pseudoalteromonas denitrificans]|uniref:PilZ domain-containing protein n=1 Tax=Pseudoalteromonas denitrificans DSM 6059 TaxID=1123010 RepID=A0A1I1P8L2_9GAMM|nr:PilZ domain-containing protein [Pseudoalteromonas denitrificans]SFD06036.1 hypothetical protein SAMN02745724_03346 [Pseudoalteromonas denitrificans DSM 6059]
MSQTKLENFNQYFQIEEAVKVNLEVIKPEQVPSNALILEQRIPPLFKLANDVNELEQSALRPLRQLSDVAEELAAFLRAQSRKIDLIMSHILLIENDCENKIMTHSYGGGGIIVNSSDDYPLDQNFCCKIFLDFDAAAVYCFAQLIKSELCNDTNTFQHTLLFTQIRSSDQELLVRASLHAQTRLLKLQAKNKNNN